MPLPDFASPHTFPTFSTLPPSPTSPPSTSSTPSPNSSPILSTPYYLLAQIKENMTIMRPTLVITDLAGESFALMFDGPIDFASRGLKKGHTVVVPFARRTESTKEGKQGWVLVQSEVVGQVRGLPGSLERVMGLGWGMREADGEGGKDGGEGGKEVRCSCCGPGRGLDGEGEGRLMKKCSRCGEVRYCSKECQVKHWSESHKGDCKLMKAIRETWP